MEVLEGIAREAGLSRQDLAEGAWAPVEKVERLLVNARELFSDDRSFQHAFGHAVAETLGPARFLAWAASPGLLYSRGFRSIDTFSTISHVEVVEVGRTRATIRYTSDIAESRLLCLSRQGQAAVLPTLWGLPPATFEESSCIAWGDPCCEYRIRWYEPRRWTPVILGALLGGAAAIAAVVLGVVGPIGAWALALGSTLVGHVYELRRTQREHLRLTASAQDAMHDLAKHDAEARRELHNLNERQRRWSRLLEEQLADRMATMQGVMDSLSQEEQRKQTTIRGVTHDIRNPLTVLNAHLWHLSKLVDSRDPAAMELLADHELAVAQIQSLVDELVRVAFGEQMIRIRPQDLDVEEAVPRLRRRLVAMAYGKDIRVSVFRTREAPSTICVDALLFDRVVDNLLTNAAKYTASGSIVVELTGSPGFLTIKVSDTGPGIEADRIEQMFEARRGPPRDRDGKSFGVGLSVVVKLMAQIGGRIEVMSKPGVGTTFWAHFPIEPVETGGERTATVGADDLIPQVVSIRPVH